MRMAISFAVQLESGLVAAIVADLSDQPGALPLLQYALTELFEQREGRQLTLAAYQAIGGVSGALTQRADDLYANLAGQEQQAVRQLFLRLVAVRDGVGDARRRVSRLELMQVAKTMPPAHDTLTTHQPDTKLVETVLDAFSRYRLLTLDHDATLGHPTVEIAHESLIEKWTRLQSWLQRSRDDLRIHRRLLTLAEEWNGAERHPDFLSTGTRLAQFEAWTATTDLALTPLEGDYLQASMDARQAQKATEADRQAQKLALEQRAKQRLQQMVTVLLVSTLLASGLAFFALSQRNRAEAQSRLTTSRQLAAQAFNIQDRQYDLALLLSVEANNIEETIEAESSLFAILQTKPRLVTYLPGHPSGVNDLSFSPDGTRLVSAGGDGHLQLWDTTTWHPISAPLPDPNRDVWSGLFTPDSQTLISAGDNGLITFWDVNTQQPLGEPILEASESIAHADLSPDGRVLAFAVDDNVISQWDFQTESWLDTPVIAHADFPHYVRYSPDGHILASVGEDDVVQLWHVINKEAFSEPLVFEQSVLKVDFSPDSGQLAIATLDGRVYLWDVPTQQFSGEPLLVENDAASAIAYHPIENWLVAGASDGRIYAWNLAEETPQRIDWQGHTQTTWDIVVSPDGTQMVTAALDGTIIVWDMTDLFLSEVVVTPIVSRLGQSLTEPNDDSVWTQLSDDGQWLGVALADGQVVLQPVGIGATKPNVETVMIRGIESDFTEVTINKDGTRVATGYGTGEIKVWKISEAEPILWRELTMPETGDPLALLVLSPNGQWLAALDEQGIALIWHLEDELAPLSVIDEEGYLIADIAFSTDNQTLITGNADRAVDLWSVSSKERLRSSLYGHDNWVQVVTLSPNDRLIASADGGTTIVLWDKATGAPLGRPLAEHTSAVTTLVFSPDGSRLASGDEAGTIMLWDTATGQLLGIPLQAHQFSISDLVFSDDGHHLLSTSSDRQVIRWRVDHQTWQDEACNIVGRNLTELEWKQYLGEVVTYTPSCDF
ncbi:MAG: WD40 repeat domain-containing protein [Chloroflexota bacterium]